MTNPFKFDISVVGAIAIAVIGLMVVFAMYFNQSAQNDYVYTDQDRIDGLQVALESMTVLANRRDERISVQQHTIAVQENTIQRLNDNMITYKNNGGTAFPLDRAFEPHIPTKLTFSQTTGPGTTEIPYMQLDTKGFTIWPVAQIGPALTPEQET